MITGIGILLFLFGLMGWAGSLECGTSPKTAFILIAISFLAMIIGALVEEEPQVHDMTKGGSSHEK